MKNILNRWRQKNKYILQSQGVCPVCEQETEFVSEHEWLRDHFICTQCGSVPRERALMHVIKTYYPDYKSLTIHESSPSSCGASLRLKEVCPQYSCSYYYPDVAPGEFHPVDGFQSQNLENMVFADESFDLFISQVVMEHVFDPARAFSEIARVLKPGGAHIFTVPIINKHLPTERWASKDDAGNIIYHHEPEYHGNPIDDEGVLVTLHWGYDIADYISSKCGLSTTIVMIDNLQLGIRAEFIEVLLSRKSESPKL